MAPPDGPGHPSGCAGRSTGLVRGVSNSSHPVIEVDALRARDASALGDDARPSDREPVRGGTVVAHQRAIFLVSVVLVVGDFSGIAVIDVAGPVDVPVPDRLALAVLVPGSRELSCDGCKAWTG